MGAVCFFISNEEEERCFFSATVTKAWTGRRCVEHIEAKSNRGEIKNDLGLNEIVIMTKIQPQIVSYQ